MVTEGPACSLLRCVPLLIGSHICEARLLVAQPSAASTQGSTTYAQLPLQVRFFFPTHSWYDEGTGKLTKACRDAINNKVRPA